MQHIGYVASIGFAARSAGDKRGCMTFEPDYSTYSLSELKEALRHIDSQAHPQRAAELQQRIQQHPKQQRNSRQQVTDELPVLRQDTVKFHGDFRTFFGIWVVNFMLTLATLGIYSAWAKVRTKRYMYANTEVDGHRFSYLADPKMILKGRLVAVVLFSAYFITSYLNPFAALVLAVVFAFLSPFLINAALRFSMRMTAYRNVRFRFHGDYWRALLAFVILPFISIFTLYLLMPYAMKKIDEYLIDERSYGDREFRSQLSTGSYYVASFGAGLIALFMAITAGFVGAFSLFGTNIADKMGLMVLATISGYLIIFTVASSFYTAYTRNHKYTHAQIDGIARFESNVSFIGLAWLRLTNLFAVLATLGFALPWVRIRSARFYADATNVKVVNDVGDVNVGDSGSVGAVGEEAATLFDVDIALG